MFDNVRNVKWQKARTAQRYHFLSTDKIDDQNPLNVQSS